MLRGNQVPSLYFPLSHLVAIERCFGYFEKEPIANSLYSKTLTSLPSHPVRPLSFRLSPILSLPLSLILSPSHQTNQLRRHIT